MTISTRMVLKLSGEAFKSETRNVDVGIQQAIAEAVAEVMRSNAQMAIVVGGGNFWRGVSAEGAGMSRVDADRMGMLATVMNGIAMADAFKNLGVPCRHMSKAAPPNFAEPYVIDKADKYLADGKVVIISGGTGSTHCTTDFATVQAACELEASTILMAKNGVEGVYDKDPRQHEDAVLIPELTYEDALAQKLAVMDLTALAQCVSQRVRMVVFNGNYPRNIVSAAWDQPIGTRLHN